VVCANCGNENASMNRVCAYCGARFRDRHRSAARPWLVAGLWSTLIYLLVWLI
jgi:hypothetical protein